MELDRLLVRVANLEAAANSLLAQHESSPSRAITLEDSYERLSRLSIAQDELIRESLRAVETGLFRAAHVLAWAGFVDFLHGYFAADGLRGMTSARPKWSLKTAEDLRDWGDYQVIEAGKDAGYFGKTVMKALHGLLNKRNECAHPSDYYPDLNETLGYVSEILQRIKFLQERPTPG